MSKLIIPKPKINHFPAKNYSFEDWLELYKHEVNLIIEEYLELVKSIKSRTLNVFINTGNFRHDMAHLIYRSSCNKDKKKIMYL
jgi:hypothetical protein